MITTAFNRNERKFWKVGEFFWVRLEKYYLSCFQVRNIAQIIYNTNEGFQYNATTINNDFVILKLESPLEFDNNVQPACLPDSDHFSWTQEETFSQCFTSGWGSLSSGKTNFLSADTICIRGLSIRSQGKKFFRDNFRNLRVFCNYLRKFSQEGSKQFPGQCVPVQGVPPT